MDRSKGESKLGANGRGPTARWSVRRGALVATALACGVVAWEYALNAWLNPDVAWQLGGTLAHLGLDAVLVLPLLALALGAGLAAARRLGMGGGDAAGVLGRVGLVALAALALAVPVTSSRDLAHEWLGQRYGLSLAEVDVAVVSSDLTVRETTQLCSFGAVRNPDLARRAERGLESAVRARLTIGLRDALVQQAALMPLLLLLLLLADGRRPRLARPRLGGLRFSWPPRSRWALAGAATLLLWVGIGAGDTTGGTAIAAGAGDAAFNACTDGGPVRAYQVAAIDVAITLNRWGDHVDEGFMYALEANVPAIRAFEAALEADREEPEALGVARVAHGLRQDPIQPLVLRANLGECLRVTFTNQLTDDDPASMHILGLPHTASSAGSAVGMNPDTMAERGQTVVYEIPIPDDPGAERAYYFHDHGAGRRRQNMGLFGAIVAEPKGAVYLDVETGQPLDTVTGSNWEAIIVDPNVDQRADGKSFREFVLMYHEVGDEAFTDIRDRENKKLPLVDELAGIYRPAARAINYRSEPFRRRLEVEESGKALGYSSYPFGDPATPIPRSYVGEGVKTRLLHGGSEVFHVHHLHGGGDRWRRNPDADPNSDFWKGLTKVPDPNLTSIHLDSQSIGPGTSYNLEHECGAGGCQQAVGDFLYHCHIGHHYLSGMWSFWRVFGTEQTADTNLYGRPLAVVPELFQNPDNPLIEPTAPEAPVSAGALIGTTVDDGRTIVADAQVTDPNTQVGVLAWIAGQLPPPGERIDNQDATVWDWSLSGAGAGLQIWGEPESDQPFANYVSATPGQRPEVRFNPKNGRYVWPLFRPQKGNRPPFTARHGGAPWLGETMGEGRLDGLCAINGVSPAVDVGNAVNRFYPVSSIAVPVPVTEDRVDADGQIFVLNEEEAAVRSGEKPPEPLTIRSNVGDCVEITFTNKISDGEAGKSFSKTNIHSHFVQFDPQASDGVITGFSYEQSVRPISSEARTLTVSAAAGATVLSVDHTDRLRPGVWLGVGLGEGTCGAGARGQPLPCTEVRQIVDLPDARTIVLDQPLGHGHAAGEAVGVEFVRYRWYSDVDFGTVFFHTHVEFKDWDHGLFGAHVVEPKGSTYHHPSTGAEVRAGTLVDVRVDPAAGGNPVAHGVAGSFREFMLFLHNNSPVEGRFQRGGGTINLRAEPWRLRPGNTAWRFSSVTHDDPWTPMLRAYTGDPVVVRGMGLVERVGGIRFTGHRFQQERYRGDGDTRDATFIGISERFDVSLEGGAGGPGGFAGDYLYYSTLGRDFESGAWGLLRVHDGVQGDLQPLPENPPGGAGGFPQLAFTGQPPPALGGAGQACPANAPRRQYEIAIDDVSIVYNDLSAPDVSGVAYRLQGRASGMAHTPLVMRANAGDCLVLLLRNGRTKRAGINVGELVFDPQRSYGAAVGLNYDSTVAPGRARRYELYADRELGVVIALDLADVEAIERGAFGAVVIEPQGATYRRPGRGEALPAGGAGVQADIVTEGVVSREFVALFSDQDRRIGQNTMPYPAAVESFNGISYAAEPLRLRGLKSRPAEVFRSSRWGDPRHVVTVPAGTSLIYRVAQPWGNQMHVPTLEGHRWIQEPAWEGSEQVFNDVLAPGMSLDLYFVGGAGGDIQAAGDYLFLDRRQPFMEGGLWHILRVTGDGSSGGDDRVSIDFASLATAGVDTVLSVRGRNGIRPAGDFVAAVTVHAGGAGGGAGACGGAAIATVPVDPGSGTWKLAQAVASPPAEVCVASPGGGVATREVGP